MRWREGESEGRGRRGESATEGIIVNAEAGEGKTGGCWEVEWSTVIMLQGLLIEVYTV